MPDSTKNSSRGDPRHVYSDKIATAILDRMAAGESLTHICDEPKMPCRRTVYIWKDQRGGAPEEFALRYARAVEDRASRIFDELLGLSDNAAEEPTHEATGAAKLQVDTRKWVLARMDHRKYGDKSSLALEGGGEGSPPVKVESTASINDLVETLRIIDEVRSNAGE